MQYDAKTPTEYMDLLEDDWRREKLEKLRALIKSKAPMERAVDMWQRGEVIDC